MARAHGLLVAFSVFGAACIGEPTTTAEAVIVPRSGEQLLAGEAEFKQQKDTVRLTIRLSGAPPGIHGAHIHQTGDCSAADASSAGGHWNPDGSQHGAPGQPSHLGDLGNIAIAEDGTGELVIENSAWRIGDGSAQDVVGKAIVIHASQDDLTSQPSGNSGSRIGCGVIE